MVTTVPLIKFCVKNLTANQIQKIQDGIDKYNSIMNEFKNNSASLGSSDEFKRMFNGFYRVRRGNEWQKAFYDIFERNRNNKEATFADLYNELFNAVGKREKSFVSKMLHTINDSSPIIDKNVLSGLNIKKKNPVDVYNTLESIYKGNLIPMADGVGFFDDFDKQFPSGKGMSKVKKIDFYLWAYFA